MAVQFGWGLKTLKANFFDRQHVVEALDRKTHRVLSRFGAFVMTTARGLIRTSKRGEYSQPGKPPKSHLGLLKGKIVFALEGRRNVVIGPARLYRKGAESVPETLEYGATVERFVPVRGQFNVSGARQRERRMVTYEPRPYMGPALQKNLPKVKNLWT